MTATRSAIAAQSARLARHPLEGASLVSDFPDKFILRAEIASHKRYVDANVGRDISDLRLSPTARSDA
jgi:regulator of sirC expression with transglutaminase-like and TPR domain